jgi:hypothetical protein
MAGRFTGQILPGNAADATRDEFAASAASDRAKLARAAADNDSGEVG